MASSSLPATMKALVVPEAGQPLGLQTIPTPTAVHGSVVVKIIATGCEASLPYILSGKSFFTFPKNMVPGGKAVGRVANVGPDTTSFEVGQLVLVESFIRARDNPNLQILWGVFDGMTPASRKFTADNWSKGTFAEYALAPLENTYALDEKRFCGSPADGGLGYTPYDLAQLSPQLVAYGGLRAISLQAGETLLVAPATGSYSGAVVQVAVAMGADVIAMSRNVGELKRLQALFPAGRVRIVPNTGDVQADADALKNCGPIDAYLDISPPVANESTHIRSCFMAVKQYGRVCLMGVISKDLAMPYQFAVWNNLTIRGSYMYERADVRGLIKLAQSGALKLGKEGGIEILGQFNLEEVNKAFAAAAAKEGFGKLTLITP